MASQTKQTYFNIETEKELLEFANNISSFSTWVKEKIKEELNRLKTQEIQKPTDIQDRQAERKQTIKWNL
jgi:hypothetical protein